MKNKPILFSGPMVRALLEGRKTQTRRIIKPQPQHIGPDAEDGSDVWKWKNWVWNGTIESLVKEDGGRCAMAAVCPHGQPGDLLWVRETWQGYQQTNVEYDEWEEMASPKDRHDQLYQPVYKADEKSFPEKWQPSIHMPRAYSRITLALTAVRAQRLKDISPEDAIAEGILVGGPLPEIPDSTGNIYSSGIGDLSDPFAWTRNPVQAYCDLWTHINGPDSWQENPWVWALTFTVHPVNIDTFLKEKTP